MKGETYGDWFQAKDKNLALIPNMMYHAGKERNEKKAHDWGEKKVGVAYGRKMAWLRKRTEKLETGVSIELKRFLDTDFTTKNYFRALDLRLEYWFHHLIKIKTHLITTLISLIRDKQVENSSNNTEFQTQLQISNSHHWFQKEWLGYL